MEHDRPPRPLDAIDRKILALLQADGKRSFAAIAEDVSLSPTAVKRRVDRLERDGVIVGYAAIVDPGRLDAGLDAMVEIYCSDRTAPADVHASVGHLPEVVSAYTVSGEADALIQVRVGGIRELERLVGRLRRDPNIVRTRTLVVLSTIVERPRLPPRAPGGG